MWISHSKLNLYSYFHFLNAFLPGLIKFAGFRLDSLYDLFVFLLVDSWFYIGVVILLRMKQYNYLI